MSALTDLFTNIANAIRTKKGTTALIEATNFPTEIANIETGITPTGTISITQNGTVDVTNYASADVNVSGGGIDFTINNASYLFYNGARLNALQYLLSLCKDITSTSNMFYYCTGLNEDLYLNNLSTSEVTNMNYMFFNCQYLPALNLSNFDTNKVLDMNNMINRCTKLETLNLGPNFYATKLTNCQYIFGNCTNLTNIIGTIKNLGIAYTQKTSNHSFYTLNLSYSSKLTHDSLMNIINGLYDLNLTYNVAGGGTLYSQALQLGATNLAKLTAQEIAIATDKGWNVA